MKFDKCTNYKSNVGKWCATKVTSENRYISGFWGECPITESCNSVEGKAEYLFTSEINEII